MNGEAMVSISFCVHFLESDQKYLIFIAGLKYAFIRLIHCLADTKIIFILYYMFRHSVLPWQQNQRFCIE